MARSAMARRPHWGPAQRPRGRGRATLRRSTARATSERERAAQRNTTEAGERRGKQRRASAAREERQAQRRERKAREKEVDSSAAAGSADPAEKTRSLSQAHELGCLAAFKQHFVHVVLGRVSAPLLIQPLLPYSANGSRTLRRLHSPNRSRSPTAPSRWVPVPPWKSVSCDTAQHHRAPRRAAKQATDPRLGTRSGG